MSNEQAKAIRDALKLAMEICDAVPSRAQHSDNYQLAYIGELVNVRPDGTHGYAVIRDALALTESASAAPIAAGVVPEGPAAASESITDNTRFMDALDGYMDAVTNDERNTDRRVKARLEIFAAVEAHTAAQPADQQAAVELNRRLMEMSEIVRADGRWDGNEFVYAVKSASETSMLDDILTDVFRLTRAAAPATDLHAAIMNLPHRMPITKYAVGSEAFIAYKEGHRDARHAAAELAAAALKGS